ncbi:hypothetical protein HK102_012682 [Quaeritorhiza haematococci]|nr:hypothetical protein HK102_012682 [Quaeritorhiza haematococci]
MKLHEFVVPLIRYCIDSEQAAHVYLFEDGLDLWLATIQNTLECGPGLLGIFGLAVPLLEYGTENLRKVLKLVEGYVVVAPLAVLQAHAVAIMDALTRLIGDLKPDAAQAITRCIDTILQASAASSESYASHMEAIQTAVLNTASANTSSTPSSTTTSSTTTNPTTTSNNQTQKPSHHKNAGEHKEER